jgi:hypothetical protein
MRTDPELDRRFVALIADLESAARAVDRPAGRERGTGRAPEDPLAVPRTVAGIGALRLVAAVVAVATGAAGVALARRLGWGIGPIMAWFAVLVPGVTLAAVMIVDRLRR